jgi:hypothetical protein
VRTLLSKRPLHCRIADVDPAGRELEAQVESHTPQTEKSDLLLQTTYDYCHEHDEAWREDEKPLAGRKN